MTDPAAQARFVETSAAILSRSHSPVIAGLGTDVAGTRAAVALAQAVGASMDHMHAKDWLASYEVMRRSGWIVTTPLQTRSRADTVLLLGSGLDDAWPDMARALALDVPPPLGRRGTRLVLHLCPPGQGPVAGATPVGSGDPLRALSALRALLAGRRPNLGRQLAAELGARANTLREASFGVAIWSPKLPPLAVEMLCGLIDDLNRTTRFAGLPITAGDGAETVAQTMTWRSGFPVRTGFAGDRSRHDPWTFDAARQVASGEADAAIWISSHHPLPPPWGDAVPTIALVAPGTVFDTPAAASIEVGTPGIDHDAMQFVPDLGAIAFTPAQAPQPYANAADLLLAIRNALPT
jgi:formylmethanofuran dehydrogenase subunit B